MSYSTIQQKSPLIFYKVRLFPGPYVKEGLQEGFTKARANTVLKQIPTYQCFWTLLSSNITTLDNAVVYKRYYSLIIMCVPTRLEPKSRDIKYIFMCAGRRLRFRLGCQPQSSKTFEISGQLIVYAVLHITLNTKSLPVSQVRT